MNKNIIPSITFGLIIFGAIVAYVNMTKPVTEPAAPAVYNSTPAVTSTTTSNTPKVVTPVKTQTKPKSTTPVVTTTKTTVTNTSNSPSNAVISKTFTLRSILSSNTIEKCTFINNEANTGIQGTFYIYGTTARGDLNISSYGTTIVHEIIKNGEVYVWETGVANGNKLTLAMTSDAGANPKTSGINVDKQIAYTCVTWPLDPNQFVLPTSVTF